MPGPGTLEKRLPFSGPKPRIGGWGAGEQGWAAGRGRTRTPVQAGQQQGRQEAVPE